MSYKIGSLAGIYFLFLISFGWFLSLGVRIAYPVLLPNIISEYNISNTLAGLTMSLLWTSYAIAQFPAGIFSDDLGEELILFLSSILSLICIVGVFLSINYISFLLFTVLFGVSTSLYGVARYTIVVKKYDAKGKAVSVTMAAGEVGSALLPLLAGIIASAAYWKYGIGFAIPLFLFLTVLLYSGMNVELHNILSINILQIFKNYNFNYTINELNSNRIIVMSLIQTFGTLTFQGLIAFLPIFLVSVKGFSPTVASIYYSLFFLFGVGYQLLSGILYNRLKITNILIINMVIIALSLLMLIIIDNYYILWLLLIPLSSLLGYSVITITYLTDKLDSSVNGATLGLIRTIYIMVGSTGPILIGIISDMGYFDYSFILLMIFPIIAIITLIFYRHIY